MTHTTFELYSIDVENAFANTFEGLFVDCDLLLQFFKIDSKHFDEDVMKPRQITKRCFVGVRIAIRYIQNFAQIDDAKNVFAQLLSRYIVNHDFNSFFDFED